MSKMIDPMLVGVWKGTDLGKYINGQINNWILKRSKDGTFSIVFETRYSNGEKITTEDKGTWFTEGNHYFETPEGEEQPDEYIYVFLDGNSVQFVDTVLNNGLPYMFTDYRVHTN